MKNGNESNRSLRRPRRTKAAWIEEVRSWRESGQSAEQYAAERGLHRGTLCAWASKAREALAVTPSGRASRGEALKKLEFLPVRVAERGAASSSSQGLGGEFEVELLNGRRVRVRGEFQREALARLLEVAEGGAAC